jgi:ribosomal protein S18 acetylase RimI-like enzyme
LSGPDGPHIGLRPLREDDIEILFRVYAGTRTEELAATGWSPDEKEHFLRAQFTAQDRHYRAHYDRTRFRVVLVNDEPAGRLYVQRGAEEIRIVDIALLPEYRGRGIGSRLLAEVIAEADAARLAVTIHVELFNPARSLYERLDFRPVEERGVYLLLRREPPLS